jgi:SAM-dependent methyltransferase
MMSDVVMVYDKDYGVIVKERGFAPGPSSILKRWRILTNLRSFNTGSVLEVGCGAGALLHDVSNLGFECSAIETSEKANDIAKYIQSNSGQKYDIYLNENPDWENSFNYVFSFDVLEHIEDDNSALTKWSSWLKNMGILFLTVPAHTNRWGIDDEAVGHYRRYNREGLDVKLRNAGFETLHFEYWGFPLSNMIRPLRNRKYKSIMDATSNKISKEKASASSGVEREAELKLLPLLQNPIGRLMMYCFDFLQKIFANAKFGDEILVIARKKS